MKKNVSLKFLLLIVLCCLSTSISIAQVKKTVLDYVDPFIGTAGDHGQLDPAATLPFGMVKLGPDTDPTNHSGYNYDTEKIIGFSHNRMGGVGCKGMGGNIRVTPGIGDFIEEALDYDKSSEQATPGYYAVTFPEMNVKAEMTVTNQVGYHRYTFPASEKTWLRIDPKASFEQVLHYEYEVRNNNEIVGLISAKNNCGFGQYRIYYSLIVDKPFENVQVINDKIFVTFQTVQDEKVEVKCVLSPVSIEQAVQDRDIALQGKNFQMVKKDAAAKWEKILNRVRVEGNEEYKNLFYTHLYHVCLTPVNSTSTAGTFMGTDGNMYTADGYTHYDSWSIWDTFRNKFPLIALTEPGLMLDFARSLTDLYKYGKYASPGPLEPVPTCRTEHAILVLLDAYQKGLTDFDVEAAYKGMLKEAEELPLDSPDKKLETAHDFWAIAQFAKALGKKEDYQIFTDKAMEYKKIWKEKFLVMNDKSDIMHGDGLYEGTLWQYRWYVPFDVDGMIDMIGSKEKYVEQLQYFFDNNLYNHGNQPDIHVPFMFNYGGAAWLTQRWVNNILAKDIIQHYGTHEKWDKPYYGRIYKTSSDGYFPEMDDDDGTMSAWYVLASMGIYPVCPGEPIYQICSPLFDKVTLNLDNGKTFEIVCQNLSEDNFYIQSARLNGKKYNKSSIHHEDIVKGGKLVFKMGAEPNKRWGR